MKITSSCIELKRIRIYAYHGTIAQERTVGNDYDIRLKVFFDISKAMESDAIKDTVNYADLYDIVKCEMMLPSNLLEHVAGRIISSVRKNFPEITGGELEIVKVKPPVPGDITGATVSVTF